MVKESYIELRKEGSKEKGKLGRPLISTPEPRAKLIRLLEGNFFLGIVAVEAKICRPRIYEWEREQEAFRTDITHARLSKLNNGNQKYNKLLWALYLTQWLLCIIQKAIKNKGYRIIEFILI